MIVTAAEFGNVLRELRASPYPLALDTETTGLSTFHGARLFSVIICQLEGMKTWYFNFQDYGDGTPFLDKGWLKDLADLWNDPKREWFMHNAIFDLHMLRADGVEIAGPVHDTMVVARLLRNDQDYTAGYSLDALAGRLGFHKDDAVGKYIQEHKLHSTQTISGKSEKILHFEKVPASIMVPYGERDAQITYRLGEHQKEQLRVWDTRTIQNKQPLSEVARLEGELLKVCLDMETVGIKVDRSYCLRAIEHEASTVEEGRKKFKEMTGEEFVDSAKALAPIFDKFGLKYPKTPKGNPSFTSDVLEGITHHVAKCILDIRGAAKKQSTYYQNFLRYADKEGAIHARMKQAGTETGRFSYADPNLQNLPKRGEEDSKFPVRKAFVPREGYCFVMIDFEQMEYRLMLDYAAETELVKKVLGGLDIHQATADMMSTIQPVSRDEAKTLNFMLLYGGGVAKLCLALFKPQSTEEDLKSIYGLHFMKGKTPEWIAKSLKLPAPQVKHDAGELRKAQRLRELYFEQLPNVKKFIRNVQDVAEKRKHIFTWDGALLHYALKEFAYKAPNGLIQGGCARIVKRGMVELHKYLKGKKSRMLVQIHDELLFEIHETELGIVPSLIDLMAKVYPPKMLAMACSSDHSWDSWGSKVKGLPIQYGKEA